MNVAKSISEKSYWVVVADQGRAVIYTHDTRRDPLNESTSLVNEIARSKGSSLTTDRGGRSFDSHGEARHALQNEKSDPKKQASSVFAKTIAERIVSAVQQGHCRGYALVAAPRFLGLLRSSLSASAIIPPYLTIDKDVVGQDTAFIEKLLADQ